MKKQRQGKKIRGREKKNAIDEEKKGEIVGDDILL